MLLRDLSGDLQELHRAMQRFRSASAARRLTQLVAQMSGLICLTLCKLDDRSGFRRWTRTARLAASEAGSATQSWVLAQEAYGHFYSGDLVEALDVAQHAQAVAPHAPSVGAALAAALGARAHGVLGDTVETRRALDRAEAALGGLTGDRLGASAFGYNEAQLRFHEGNAYTHVGATEAAFEAQDRALALCAPGDYTDQAMTRLDRAQCLMTAGDPPAGLAEATATLADLTAEQREGIITLRGQQLLRSLPPRHQRRPAARDLRDLLMSTDHPPEPEDS